ncbi:hypothetical protein Leryth_012754 [Lithospermum erythrorhizon]|nr:hypothetical protein Leryth_012754 [Lithospermum erythrorhizon]
MWVNWKMEVSIMVSLNLRLGFGYCFLVLEQKLHFEYSRVSRMVTKGLLMHLGCDVTTVSSSDECLRVLSQDHKVILVDVSMPGEDSYDIAVRVHERFSNCLDRPLIVALTGSTDRVTKGNCSRFGIDGVILKPVSLDKIRNIFSELLQHGALLET